MVDIQCTRCNATGTGYETNYVAKFSLIHERGCGARIGIPKFTETSVAAKIETPLPEPKEEKPKKKKASKKAQTKILTS